MSLRQATPSRCVTRKAEGVASVHPGGQGVLFAEHGPRSPTGPPTICDKPPCGAVNPNTQLAQIHNSAKVTGVLNYRGACIPLKNDCIHASALPSRQTFPVGPTSRKNQNSELWWARFPSLHAVPSTVLPRGNPTTSAGLCSRATLPLASSARQWPQRDPHAGLPWSPLRCCLGWQSRPFDRPMLQGDPPPCVIGTPEARQDPHAGLPGSPLQCCLGGNPGPFDRPMLQGDPPPTRHRHTGGQHRASNRSQTAPATVPATGLHRGAMLPPSPALLEGDPPPCIIGTPGARQDPNYVPADSCRGHR